MCFNHLVWLKAMYRSCKKKLTFASVRARKVCLQWPSLVARKKIHISQVLVTLLHICGVIPIGRYCQKFRTRCRYRHTSNDVAASNSMCSSVSCHSNNHACCEYGRATGRCGKFLFLDLPQNSIKWKLQT